MSNTATLEGIDQMYIVNGARVIATMPIGTRIKDDEADLAAKDLQGFFYESHVEMQAAIQTAVEKDSVMPKLTSEEDRRERKTLLVTWMVEEHLRNR